jgi:uncharacterized protein (TIGR00369 family)
MVTHASKWPPMKNEPADPNWEAKVRDSFARQGAMATIGARLSHVAPGEADIEIDRTPAVQQQHGYVHGGVVGMIADSAGGYAGFSMMPAGATVLTVEYKMNLMNPADGARIVARGRVVKPGRTLVVCQVDVYSIKEGRERHCALMTQTLLTVAGKSDDLQV